jgi:hypothetical protein
MPRRERPLSVRIDPLNDPIIDLPIQQVKDLGAAVAAVDKRLRRGQDLRGYCIGQEDRLAGDVQETDCQRD